MDCGIIYASDAYSAKLTVAAEATADMCGQVIYSAAILNTSTQQDAAAAFLQYLQSAEASAEFEKVLFIPPEQVILYPFPLYRAGRFTRPAHIPFVPSINQSKYTCRSMLLGGPLWIGIPS